jgi:hypothetical protein
MAPVAATVISIVASFSAAFLTEIVASPAETDVIRITALPIPPPAAVIPTVATAIVSLVAVVPTIPSVATSLSSSWCAAVKVGPAGVNPVVSILSVSAIGEAPSLSKLTHTSSVTAASSVICA